MSFKKGDTVKVIKGKKNVGTTGVIVWIGPDKFHPSAGNTARVGIKTASGEAIYVSMGTIALLTEEAAPAEAEPALPFDGAAPAPAAPGSSTKVEALEAALVALEARVKALEAERTTFLAALAAAALANKGAA
jgi:hypothetical protein